MVCGVVRQNVHLDEVMLAHVIDGQLHPDDDPGALGRWKHALHRETPQSNEAPHHRGHSYYIPDSKFSVGVNIKH